MHEPDQPQALAMALDDLGHGAEGESIDQYPLVFIDGSEPGARIGASGGAGGGEACIECDHIDLPAEQAQTADDLLVIAVAAGAGVEIAGDEKM